jgi:hypothetical protein
MMETYKTMKKVVVLLDKDRYEIEVDDSDFEDYRLEACTRVVERLFASGNYKISPFIFCEEMSDVKLKAKVKFGTYNSYKILINASLHEYAEKLRKIFMKENNIDLAKEPIQSKFN